MSEQNAPFLNQWHPIETAIVMIAFGCGIAVGRMLDMRMALHDWQEGYESCKRD